MYMYLPQHTTGNNFNLALSTCTYIYMYVHVCPITRQSFAVQRDGASRLAPKYQL